MPADAPPQTTWRNPVKQKLAAGDAVFALTLTVASADIAAHAARMGFDFLWVEMEHSPITLETLRNMVLATRGLPAAPFARIPVNEIWTAKRVLDAGVYGVIFPFTSTPELARQAVAACRYPPLGSRGSGAVLAKFCWPGGENCYHDSADDNIVTIAIIEQAQAVENIEEIAATPGLDVLFIGTSDLSFSLGLRGRQDEPLLREAIARVAAAAKLLHRVRAERAASKQRRAPSRSPRASLRAPRLSQACASEGSSRDAAAKRLSAPRKSPER